MRGCRALAALAALVLAGCAPAVSAPAAPSASPSPTGLPGAPPAFVAVLGGRLAVFDAVTGVRQRWLSDPAAKTYDSSPSIAGDDVVFLRRPDGHQCGGEVLRVPLAGGQARRIATPAGVEITAAAADRTGTTLAYGYTPCGGDARPRLRVVSLTDGSTLAEGRSTFRANGVLSLTGLAVRGPYVAVHLGIHLQSWVTVHDTRESRGVVDLDRSSRLATPDGCLTQGATWAGDGLLAYELCMAEPAVEHRLVTYAAPGFRRGAEEPVTFDLSASDADGRLIGVRSSDEPYERRIVQRHRDAEHLLPLCTDENDETSDACAGEPVW